MIRVLMVVDGFGFRDASFSVIDPTDDWFSLTYFVGALASEPTFQLTKAHRGVDPGNPADPSVIMNFRFDQHDLSLYHVILLFGFASDTDVLGSGHPERLSDPELFRLAGFMQTGGGVFATGDHESLGRPLCGLVPRVRSMRKWFFPLDGGSVPRQFGEPDAPPAVHTTIDGVLKRRLDTTMTDWADLDPSGGNWFDDQSDDNPQVLEFRFPQVTNADGTTGFVCWVDPVFGAWDAHPVLYTVLGVGRDYPDHMHEGECITPWETDRVFTFQGTSFPEYPPAASGPLPLPQIVAWSFSNGTSIDNHHGEPHVGDPEPAEFRPFGAIGVYDGRPANVGRVVVDSTFHHFVDINLIGDPTAPDPKTKGFTTPAGQPILDTLGQYYRSIVFWLAPPSAQMAAWHLMLSATVRNVAIREAAPRSGQAPAVRAFGNGVTNRLRSKYAEPIVWMLATANLDPRVVGAIAKGNADPCSGPDPGVPSRREIAHYLVGATALEVIATTLKRRPTGPEGRAQASPDEVIATGQSAGLALLADAAIAEGVRRTEWAKEIAGVARSPRK
jgi:hypothetical protein